MVFNLKRLSIAYVRGFKEYIKIKGLETWSEEQQYNLLSYAICKLYDLESAPYAKGTSVYGVSCKNYLSKLKRTPKHINKIPLSERVELVCMVQAYFVSTFLTKGMKEVVLDGGEDALG